MHVSKLLAPLLAALPLTTGRPHESIINTPTHRDVGLIFTESHYKGHSNFLLENREHATCYPLNVDGAGHPVKNPAASVKICMKHCTCLFFTESDSCGVATHKNFVAKVDGPTDVAEVKTPGGHVFKSYMCGQGLGDKHGANFTIVGVKHVVGEEVGV